MFASSVPGMNGIEAGDQSADLSPLESIHAGVAEQKLSRRPDQPACSQNLDARPGTEPGFDSVQS